MAELVTKKRTVLSKIESVYGTDITPVGSADAVLIKNLTLKPIKASVVSRDIIRPYLGISEQLLAEKYVEVDFEVEMVGSGIVGVAPAAGFDSLMRACGFTKSTTLTSCTAACATLIVTVTKASHGYAVGDVVKMTGFTDGPKNISATILTVPTANTFTYSAAGASDEISPAAGSPKINSGVVYVPVSSAFESVTIYMNVDGTLHTLTGARGTLDFSVVVKQIPTIKFTMTGLYSAVIDAAAPTCDFSLYKVPQVVNTQNTLGFSLFSYSGYMESFALQIANDIQYITLVGSESVKLLDRKPSGTLIFQATSIATKDFFTPIAANTKGAFSLDHGSLNGYKVSFACSSVHLGDPSYQDSNGVQMLSVPFQPVPTTGNDELSITFK
jgi:hypothetical protein